MFHDALTQAMRNTTGYAGTRSVRPLARPPGLKHRTSNPNAHVRTTWGQTRTARLRAPGSAIRDTPGRHVLGHVFEVSDHEKIDVVSWRGSSGWWMFRPAGDRGEAEALHSPRLWQTRDRVFTVSTPMRTGRDAARKPPDGRSATGLSGPFVPESRAWHGEPTREQLGSVSSGRR